MAAVLLRCAMLLPGVFLLRSDGAWQREWARGSTPGAAGRGVGARRLVADLFGDLPEANPFHPTPLIDGEG